MSANEYDFENPLQPPDLPCPFPTLEIYYENTVKGIT